MNEEEFKEYEEYFRKTVPNILSGTKGELLKQIDKLKTEDPNITKLSTVMNESMPNLAFHVNGNKKTKDGLVQYGFITKELGKKGISILRMTPLGERALKVLSE